MHVLTQMSNLTVAVTSALPASAQVGQSYSWAFSIANTSTHIVTGIAVTPALPAGATQDSNLVPTTLAPGESIEITGSLAPSHAGSFEVGLRVASAQGTGAASTKTRVS